jgi:hypothetical protein
MTTVEDVRTIALSLPETIERTSYGTPGFRVKDRLFARIRDEGDVLVVWCADEGEKAALIASEPRRFFTTPHYDGHAMVLVRLPEVAADELRELLIESWLLRAPKREREAHAAELGVELG